MTNVQKILFAGMILSAVVWGNHFNGGNRASGVAKNNPLEFSALESSSFFAQSIGAVEPASQTSSSIGFVPAPEAAAQQTQTEPSRPETFQYVNMQAGDELRIQNQYCSEVSAVGSEMGCGGLFRSATAPAAPIFYRAGNDSTPTISAQEALVADLQSGETYFEVNKDGRWPLASLTKLMTAVMVARNIDLTSRLTLAPADFSAGEETDFFKTGLAYSANDVLMTALLLSKNEAAEALADSFGREKFINGMNDLAAAWGMQRTYFADPTGLSNASQSTPQDLEKLALHLYQNYPKILEATRRRRAAIIEFGSGKKTTIPNINAFAGRSDFLGGKTGYTDEASGNLLSIFSYGRRPILFVVLGTSDRFGETENLLNWFKNNFRANG